MSKPWRTITYGQFVWNSGYKQTRETPYEEELPTCELCGKLVEEGGVNINDDALHRSCLDAHFFCDVDLFPEEEHKCAYCGETITAEKAHRVTLYKENTEWYCANCLDDQLKIPDNMLYMYQEKLDYEWEEEWF